mgnify:CR=1 FL=1|jgi:hypothetical protein
MNYEYMTEEEESIIDEMFEVINNDNKTDMVNHPSHYTQGGIECIDALESMLGKDAFIAYCRGTAVKYLWRTGHKWDDVEDLKKAVWYIEKAISVRG